MLKEFIDRENEIFNILDKLKDNDIDFILIGGYAISAFKHRFSVDADVVVKEEQVDKIIGILEKNNFKPYKSVNLENVYRGKFKAFIKKEGLPVTVDLLINAISCRQTNASWSFDLFNESSINKSVKGIEKEMSVKIPSRELLISTKIHSCRLTDIRDVVAICEGADINKIVNFAKRGDITKLKICVSRFKEAIRDKNFVDAFKGVFSIEKFPSENIEFSEKIMERLEEALNEH